MKLAYLCAIAVVVLSCGGEDPALAKKKLDVILEDDLSAIVSDISEENLLEKPFYEMVSYQTYDKGEYSAKAVADFYFFKTVRAKIVRKYRYSRSKGLWDRYFNEYRLLPDSASTPQSK